MHVTHIRRELSTPEYPSGENENGMKEMSKGVMSR